MTWERLAHAVLGSDGDTFDTGTFTAKKNLRIIVWTKGTTGGTYQGVRFNDDTGNNYAHRRSEAGGNDGTNTSTNFMQLSDSDIANGGGYTVTDITNISDKEKLAITHSVMGSSSGAGTAPDRDEFVGKWANTSAQITKIQVYNQGSGNFVAGSYITVFGESSDIITDEKTTITNVPAGTRYEETDTRKIYRRTASSTTTVSQAGTGENKGLFQSLVSGTQTATKIGFELSSGHELIGKTATTISLYLWKDGSPTGNGSMKIYNSSGTLQATSTNTKDWATLGTSAWGTKTDFSFSGHEIVAGDRFVIEGGSGDDSNRVFLSMNTSTASNTKIVFYHTGGWNTSSYSLPVKFDVVYTIPAEWKERGTA